MPVPLSDQVLHGEGRLDVDLGIVMSVMPWVRAYQPQPMRVPIVVAGVRSIYTPDGRVLGLKRPLCIEVKPLEKLNCSPDLDGRKDAIEKALDQIGEDFVILTENEIRAEPLFSNAKRVWSCAQNLETDEVVTACRTLRETSFSTMGEVVAILGNGHHAWRIAYGLIGLKVLAVDLNCEISNSSAATLGSRGWI